MARLLTYRTYQRTFAHPITHISDTFLIYQAERKWKRAVLAVDLEASDAWGHFGRIGGGV